MPASVGITVVIPTSDRPSDVERCLESLATVCYPNWSVLIVDQSRDALTEAVAAAFKQRLPNLTYHRTAERGLSRARNTAIRVVDTDILAFLDDDCTVDSGWLEQVAAAFTRYPQAALIFGTVRAAPHDWQQYFVPCYEVAEERVLRGRLAFLKVGGMGAGMYLRRSLCRNLGPMDIYAGAGGHFHASEDRDYTYRALAAGLTVIETPSIVIQHFGRRGYRSGAASRLMRSGAYAQGAVDVKVLRCKDASGLIFIVRHFVEQLTKIDVGRLILLRGSTGAAWITHYILGIVAGLRLPLDQRFSLFGYAHEYESRDLIPADQRREDRT
jgi:glycosyltransferase involved in cell wall biosynthesis